MKFSGENERMRQALLNIIKQDQKVTGTTSEDAWEHDGPFATIARAALEPDLASALLSLSGEVERLIYNQDLNLKVCRDLIGERDALASEVERMREALAPFAAIAVHFDKEFASTPLKDFHVVGVELKQCRNARDALGKDTPDGK